MRNAGYPDLLRAPVKKDPGLIDIEVYDGTKWVSLNDHSRYELGAGSLADSTQGVSRNEVRSTMYDGSWITHSTKDNVQETLEVYVLGHDQVTITENIDDLTEAFSQYVYNVRISLGNHVETWRCFPADWSISRGHEQIHNIRATVRLSVPRHPRTVKEVRQ